MFKISTHIGNEIKEEKIILQRLQLNERTKILKQILDKYIDTSKKGEWMWEKFKQYEFLVDDMAWSYIKDFVKNDECIMFFNQDEEKEMFVFQSGDDLDYLLSETYGFEFYITDRKASYMLCFNHHNILYGCGDAESWIKRKKM